MLHATASLSLLMLVGKLRALDDDDDDGGESGSEEGKEADEVHEPLDRDRDTEEVGENRGDEWDAARDEGVVG